MRNAEYTRGPAAGWSGLLLHGTVLVALDCTNGNVASEPPDALMAH